MLNKLKDLLVIKVFFLSIKIKIYKILNKNYDPYPSIYSNLEFSPSLYINNIGKKKDYHQLSILKSFNKSEWSINARKKFIDICKISHEFDTKLRFEKLFNYNKNFQHKKIVLEFDENHFVPIDILSPSKLPKGIVICMQGANSGSNLNYNYPIMPNDYLKIKNRSDLAYQAIKNDYIAICYERIACGYRRETKLNSKNTEKRNQLIDTALHLISIDKTLMGESIKEINALIKYIKNNISKDLPIFMMGYSDGGTTAIACAAVNLDIDGIAVGCCVGNYKDTSLKRNATGLNDIPEFLKWFELEDILSLIAPRKCLILSATEDHIWPYKFANKIFKNISQLYNPKKNLKLVKVIGKHNYYPKQMWQNFNEILDE